MKLFFAQNKAAAGRKNRQETEKNLHALAFLPQQELFARLFSSRNGLTGEEAQRRLEDGGKT